MTMNTPKWEDLDEAERGAHIRELSDTLAERFYRETGMMAPGKDQPPGLAHSYEERRAAWEDWLSRKASCETVFRGCGCHG